jgi:membrane associated rhomboid family serine protease
MNDEIDYSPFQQGSGAPEPPRRAEPLFNIPGVVVLIIAITVVVQVAISYGLSASAVDRLYYYGGFIPARYGGGVTGETWAALFSPVTYAFLHGGWEHLIFNDIWLAVFGAPVAVRFGVLRFLIFWIVTSIASALAFDISNFGSQALLVGASGAISGLTGASCRFVWSGRGLRDPESYRMAPALSITAALSNKEVLGFIIFWFVANVALAATGLATPGAAQAVAWQAHLGGFLVGFVFFPLFDPVRRLTS